MFLHLMMIPKIEVNVGMILYVATTIIIRNCFV